MKKFLFIALCLTACFACNHTAKAQSTSPRFSTTAGKDNSFRALRLGYTTTSLTADDTITIVPNKFVNYYRYTLTDSVYLESPTMTYSYAGDEIVLIVSGASGNKIKFSTSNWKSAGTATLSSGALAVITFVCSGTKWVEKSRVVQ